MHYHGILGSIGRATRRGRRIPRVQRPGMAARGRDRVTSRLARWLLLVLIGVHLIASALSSNHLQLAQAAGTISGRVFHDHNSNGLMDAGATILNDGGGQVGVAADEGIGNIVVTAYDARGVVRGTTPTAADGSYTLAATGAGPYRIEFSNLPPGFQPGVWGPNSGTTVQFVPDGSSPNVDLGIILPGDYCQNNPELVTSCYVFGDQVNGPNSAAPVVISFPYSAGSNGSAPGPYDQPTTHTLMVPANQAGTTWGVAYDRATQRLFVAAFMKRHSGFGPAGTGAIYAISGGTTTLYADLNAIFGAGTAGADPHDPADYNADNGNASWDAVGKVALGGLAVAEDGTALYAMNLANRTLYELPLNATPTSANIRSSPVPLNPPNCPAAGDVRPFALQVYYGTIYAGMVCSAESTGQPGDMWAYVYAVDPATLAFGAAPVFQMSLDYPRGYANRTDIPAHWQPWTTSYRSVNTPAGNPRVFGYPQPWLTDLAFDKGNLILGFRDRAGDQGGNSAKDNPATPNALYSVRTAGDTLRACGSPATGWTLENNARCNGAGTGAQNSGQGPGGGEYYFRDEFQLIHDEVSLGGLAQVPGFPDIVVTAFDPVPLPMQTFDAGARWLINGTGDWTKAYRIYNGVNGSSTNYGKANGLGGLVALCNAAPIEIGNRLWYDIDANGFQDPSEPLVVGATVRLYAPDGVTVLASAVTDAQGTYYFSSAPGTSTPSAVYGIRGLTFNTAGFSVRVDNPADYQPGGPLDGWYPTRPNEGGAAVDMRDSDGVVVNGFPVTTLATGGPGANNHTYDFGFTRPSAIQLGSFAAVPDVGGIRLRWETAAEQNTWGFYLYRSADRTRAHAIRITPQLIAATGGPSGGASYSWLDATAAPNTDYAYWLQEVELGGTVHEYGPATAARPGASASQIFLPLVRR
jgi:hypothetical protein